MIVTLNVDFLINEICKQMKGYGQMPTQRKNEKLSDFEKRAKEFYSKYWTPVEDYW